MPLQGLPTTMPKSALALDLYVLLTVAATIIWDLIRNCNVDRAYVILLFFLLPVTAMVYKARALCGGSAPLAA